MAVNDVYRLLVNQQYLGANVLNVFWYRNIGSGSDPVPADALIDTFATNVWGDVVAIQNLGVITNLYEALNFNDTTDFGSLTSNAPGARPGEGLPSFNTWSYIMKRGATTIRNGRKAIAGVSEPDQSNGQPDAGITALLTAAGVAMAANLTGTDGSLWTPVIVRKPIVPLPTIPFAVVMKDVDFRRLSTQSSRKV